MSQEFLPPDRRRSDLPSRSSSLAPIDVTPIPVWPVRLGVRDYVAMIARHKSLVALIVAVVTAPVALYLFLTPDYYTARARVEIAMERPGRVGEGPDPQGMVSADPAYFNTQLQLITNPVILRRVVDELDLERDEVFTAHMIEGGRILRRLLRLWYIGRGSTSPADYAAQPTSAELAAAQQVAPYVAELEHRVAIRPVLETRTAFRETRLADIVVDHQSPRLAAAIANAVADAFVDENRDRNSRGGANTNAYLARRIEALQGEVRQAEEALIAYSRQNEILSLEPGQNVSIDRLVDLNKQLLVAENERKLAEANYQQAQRPESAGALGEDVAKGVIVDTEIRLADLRAKRAQLLVGATEQWPEVREITQQIAALEANARTVRSGAATTALASLRTKYQQALALEAALRADFNVQRGRIQVQNRAAVSYRLMQQEVSTKQGLLAEALKRLGENDLAQAEVANNASVLDHALIPNANEPDGPWRLPFVAAALVFSLLAGVGFVLTREAFNHTLRSSVDVEQALDLPAVGTIRAAPSRQARLFTRGADRVAWNEFAEDYRRLRTSMLLPASGEVAKTWLVTSSHPHEGKTTTAINLATSLVKSGSRALLVDADLRRPRLHTILGFENDRGLTTLLTAAVLDISDVVRHHETSGTFVLPAGPDSVTALELLGSDRMAEVLASLHGTFDHVIIDSPPIALYPDGLAIASQVDGVLLVVKASTTPIEAVRESKRLLQRVGARMCGVVLNRVDLSDDKDLRLHQHLRGRQPGIAASSPRRVGWPRMTSDRALPGRRIGVLLASLTGMQILASLALQVYLLMRFGAGVTTDAFYAGAIVSQVIAAVAIDTLTVVLVPLLASKSEAELRDDAWSLCLAATITYTGIALVLSAVASLLTSAVVPGFGADAKALTASLMRIHLWGMGGTACTLVLTSVYQIRGRFLWPQLTALGSSLVALLFVVATLDRWGIEAAAWAQVLAYTIPGGIMLVALGRPARIEWRWDLLRQVISRQRPLLLSKGYLAASAPFDRLLISFLPAGSLVIFDVVWRLLSAAQRVVVQGILAPVLPELSRLASDRAWPMFRLVCRQLAIRAVALTLLMVAGLEIAVLGAMAWLADAHGAIAGNLTADSLRQFGWLAALLAGVLPCGVLATVFSNAYYAQGDTSTPSRIAAAALTCGLALRGLGYWLGGITGLAVTASVSSLLLAVWLAVPLNRRTARLARERERQAPGGFSRWREVNLS